MVLSNHNYIANNDDLKGIYDFIRDEVPDKEPPKHSPMKRSATSGTKKDDTKESSAR